VRDDTIYLTSSAAATPGDLTKPEGYYLVALDAKTGQQRWRYRAEAPYVQAGVCLRQPVVTSDAVFAVATTTSMRWIERRAATGAPTAACLRAHGSHRSHGSRCPDKPPPTPSASTRETHARRRAATAEYLVHHASWIRRQPLASSLPSPADQAVQALDARNGHVLWVRSSHSLPCGRVGYALITSAQSFTLRTASEDL